MRTITEEEHKKRLELYEDGYSDVEIGKILYVSSSAIYNWRKKNKLPTKQTKVRGRALKRKDR